MFFAVYFIPVWSGYFAALSAVVLIPLLAFAELTDYFDGYFARKRGEVSDFGKLFDPFCDVLLHITVFFCFALSGYMPAFALILIVYREFVINFVRLMAAQKGVTIGARKGGKAKTITYIVACYYMLVLECCRRLFGVTLPAFTPAISIALAVLCVILAYISLADYLLAFKDVVFPKNNQAK